MRRRWRWIPVALVALALGPAVGADGVTPAGGAPRCPVWGADPYGSRIVIGEAAIPFEPIGLSCARGI